jgi:hypothetical protein
MGEVGSASGRDRSRQAFRSVGQRDPRDLLRSARSALPWVGGSFPDPKQTSRLPSCLRQLILRQLIRSGGHSAESRSCRAAYLHHQRELPRFNLAAIAHLCAALDAHSPAERRGLFGHRGVEQAEVACDDGAQVIPQLGGPPTAISTLEALLRLRPVFLSVLETLFADLRHA